MGHDVEWKLCTNSFCNGSPIASGKLPASWGVGDWHRLSLAVVNTTATVAMDGHVFYSGRASMPRQQPAAATASTCEEQMNTLPPGQELVGNDYRQTQLHSDPNWGAAACIKACCADVQCTAWAVFKSWMPSKPTCTHGTVCCFLKSGHPTQRTGSGQAVCGQKHQAAQPPHPFGGVIPSSGWAALVSTLGNVQYDNFKLEGRASGAGAVETCAGTAAAGSKVVSTACDAPGSLHAWDKLRGDQLRLRSTNLCMAVDASNTVVLSACSTTNSTHSLALLVHDRTTGRITTNSSTCLDVTAAGEPGQAGRRWPVATAGSQCVAIPSDTQQLQWHPHTGALRPKASSCTTNFAGTVNQYRDCCLAVC